MEIPRLFHCFGAASFIFCKSRTWGFLLCQQLRTQVVLMNLLYSHSVPSLTYCAEVKELSASIMSKCNGALNDSIRYIFSYNRWESIRTLRQQLGYNDLTTTFAIRTRRFYAKIPLMKNETVIALYHIVVREIL